MEDRFDRVSQNKKKWPDVRKDVQYSLYGFEDLTKNHLPDLSLNCATSLNPLHAHTNTHTHTSI